MGLIKKHVDIVVVLGGILGSVLWMNHQFSRISKQVRRIEIELAFLNAKMIMKNEMPQEKDLHRIGK